MRAKVIHLGRSGNLSTFYYITQKCFSQRLWRAHLWGPNREKEKTQMDEGRMTYLSFHMPPIYNAYTRFNRASAQLKCSASITTTTLVMIYMIIVLYIHCIRHIVSMEQRYSQSKWATKKCSATHTFHLFCLRGRYAIIVSVLRGEYENDRP